jgi:hypothetical protein
LRSFHEAAHRKYAKWESIKDKEKIIALTFKALREIIRAFGFKKGEISGVIGFEDHTATGYALALAEIANTRRVKVTFDGAFGDGFVFEAEGWARGRTSIGRLLLPLIKLALSKPVWRLIKPYIFKKKKQEA